MTKHAYVEITYISGIKTGIRLDMDNQMSVHKLRNLKAGSITTFDILEDDPSFKIPTNYVDKLVEQTKTFYPANIALLEVKIVELKDEPH